MKVERQRLIKLDMVPVLSQNERQALSRFLVKVISDVEKVSALFESRGADAALTRAAQANLEATLAQLGRDEQYEEAKVLSGVYDLF